MIRDDWPSLIPHLTLAERLHGASGEGRVAGWLEGQLGHVDDPAFARLFSDHIDLPGIAPSDYAHRLIRGGRGTALGGIRFYGQDVGRPFVEVVAHDFADLGALVDAVAAEWRGFAPRYLRVLGPVGVEAGSVLDMTVHVARYGGMRPADGRVVLGRFAEVEAAFEMVERRYATLALDDARWTRRIRPASRDTIRELHAAGRVHAVLAAGDIPVGCLAAAPGAVAWIVGDEIREQVVTSEASGRGYAASAQGALAAAAEDADRLLIGTIDGRNHASRRTAERAGREAVLAYRFVPLE